MERVRRGLPSTYSATPSAAQAGLGPDLTGAPENQRISRSDPNDQRKRELHVKHNAMKLNCESIYVYI